MLASVPLISLSMNPEHMTPKHFASKQCAAVLVRFAMRLSYGFPFAAAPSFDALFVGHAGGQVVKCTCSPCAIKLHLARGLVFSPHSNAPTFPHRPVSTTFNPAPSPGAQMSFSYHVGISLRWWLRMRPSSEMSTAAFQIHPSECAERSLNPTWAKILFCAQACWRERISGPWMRSDSRARWVKKWWLSMGAAMPAWFALAVGG